MLCPSWTVRNRLTPGLLETRHYGSFVSGGCGPPSQPLHLFLFLSEEPAATNTEIQRRNVSSRLIIGGAQIPGVGLTTSLRSTSSTHGELIMAYTEPPPWLPNCVSLRVRCLSQGQLVCELFSSLGLLLCICSRIHASRSSLR